jgi:hypothetical protein
MNKVVVVAAAAVVVRTRAVVRPISNTTAWAVAAVIRKVAVILKGKFLFFF